MTRYIAFIFIFSLIITFLIYSIFYKKRWDFWKTIEKSKIEDSLNEIKAKKEIRKLMEEKYNEFKKRK